MLRLSTNHGTIGQHDYDDDIYIIYLLRGLLCTHHGVIQVYSACVILQVPLQRADVEK